MPIWWCGENQNKVTTEPGGCRPWILDVSFAPTPIQPSATYRAVRWALGLIAVGSFLLLVHNFGVSLSPRARVILRPEKMSVYSPVSTFAFTYPYRGGLPDDAFSQRSRVQLLENGQPLYARMRALDEVTLVGGGRWSHLGDQIIFTTKYNSDPRTNGLTYTLLAPRFYSVLIGRWSVVVFLTATLTLGSLCRPRPRKLRPEVGGGPWRWHLAVTALLFIAGLYCNTGTMSGYANTTFPEVNKTTGYLYNPDHVHFRVLYDFVNGADRHIWENALLLRRILYPVLAWPFMRIAGFEIGGTLASLALNLAGFLAGAFLLRKHVGTRGAIFAAWLMALYPGAAYWGGLPYPYALIFPGSLLLMMGMLELSKARGRRFGLIALAMGLVYLGYDLAVFFIPATVVLLVLKRRYTAALVAGTVQAAPLAVWLCFLRLILKQPLENANSGVYSLVLLSFKQLKDVHLWWSQVSHFADLGGDVFFGSNFIFIPALFLGALAFNTATGRIRLGAAEASVLLVALGLFLLNNLAPIYGGTWNMRGTWIARLYQPIIPALILYLARWWEALPPLTSSQKLLVYAGVGATFVGNALIVFGPITDNPLKVSEYAYYKFYNHTDIHWVYEKSLHDYGRRPIGFPRPQP